MRALVVPSDPPSRLELTDEYPRPVPAEGEVLVRVRWAGICATDLEIVRGYMQFHGILGHEFVGTVVTGPARWVGQRVVAEINCACGVCPVCQRGQPNHCPRRTVLGIAGRNGAFAEYVAVPEANCRIVPACLSDEEAVFVEPLAAAAHVLDVQPIVPTTRVAVIGSGRLGSLVAQVLALQGCELVVWGRNPRSLALAREYGVDARAVESCPWEACYDVVVECTGSPDGLPMALALCRPQGTIVLKSTCHDRAPLDLAPVVVNEVRIVGNRCGDFSRALHLLATRRVRVRELITARYPLARGREAFAAAARPENTKVLLEVGVT